MLAGRLAGCAATPPPVCLREQTWPAREGVQRARVSCGRGQEVPLAPQEVAPEPGPSWAALEGLPEGGRGIRGSQGVLPCRRAGQGVC